jgi:hypothetical protein
VRRLNASQHVNDLLFRLLLAVGRTAPSPSAASKLGIATSQIWVPIVRED